MRKKQPLPLVHARETPCPCPLEALALEFAALHEAIDRAHAAGDKMRLNQIDERIDMIRAAATAHAPTTPIGAAFLLGLAHEQFQYYLDTCAPETPPGLATFARHQLETAIKQMLATVAIFIGEKHKVPPRLAAVMIPAGSDLTRLLQRGDETAGEGQAND